VLIGPNGGGKTNLLKVVRLLKASAADQLGKFVQREGGMQPIKKLQQQPEAVNFNDPPSKRVDEACRRSIGRSYKKTVDDAPLFSKADPEVAYASCPYLRHMLDTMLNLARQANL
jgi:predicted ATPase